MPGGHAFHLHLTGPSKYLSSEIPATKKFLESLQKDLASPPFESQEQLGSDNSISQINISVDYKHISWGKTLPPTFIDPSEPRCPTTIMSKLLRKSKTASMVGVSFLKFQRPSECSFFTVWSGLDLENTEDAPLSLLKVMPNLMLRLGISVLKKG